MTTSGKSGGSPHGETKNDAKNDGRPVAASKTEGPGEKNGASPSGRIVHDSRGNAVWSWGRTDDSGSTATTSKMLKKLDFGDLRVEDDAPPVEQPQSPNARSSGYGPGYNPYDRSAPVRIAPKKHSSR